MSVAGVDGINFSLASSHLFGMLAPKNFKCARTAGRGEIIASDELKWSSVMTFDEIFLSKLCRIGWENCLETAIMRPKFNDDVAKRVIQ
jgi:hypothetical protein